MTTPVPGAKKALGQHFLRDANIARKIVGALAIGEEDTVLEIGPGPGALTGFLLNRAPARVILVEKDAFWAKTRMREGRGRLSVILADALAMPWSRFSFPWKCIGNLPYNVASPLLWDICGKATGLAGAVFMLQKEVGLRIVAKPGGSSYGALSVWVQSFMRPKLEFFVPPTVFHPKPKVDSAVLSFAPRADDEKSCGGTFEPDKLARTLHACFRMRRKQLGTIARFAGKTPDALEALAIDPALRPENLTPRDFHRLSCADVFS
jgi:16S rRNA (adenine1518-N6/adenine1519-N6)-dimethyltransferase